jgi:hypothetical protein
MFRFLIQVMSASYILTLRSGETPCQFRAEVEPPRYYYEACFAGSAAEGGFVKIALTFTSGRDRKERVLKLQQGFCVR